ncbi:flagellar motor switch protein FliN [Microbacterium sp. NE2HP2]|jgi:flagellar motor switch protein FliN/FliY|uniref:flagellar motor switch protein FliN n=1 Tax=Microbacterium TaxID=33882 RepID=UPI0022B03167|nr:MULTISPECIES: flagellar motor switch protein FliN [Microbacterium]MCZ4068670.1 flagellar motor switch protein FliN [Microbacterium sp. H37-C3]MDD7945944.1 flagellar motor switch protein FliN [Microbacterium plantarum]WHE36041.1 flagellar motor switch protein FliN [Microbacterium sp. BDGP8]WRK17320.1 flagellar motor switch protein FliN [Microbacterium plantarum]
MTSTTTHEAAAAAAFADRLPTASRITARPGTSAGETGDAVIVSSVGDTSAALAVVVLDESALLGADAALPLPERLRDALDAAATAFGPSVLGEATIGDASALFAHPAAQVFDLVDEDARVIGRLAVRVSHPAAASPRRLQRIAGVEMELTVEVGRTRMTVRDVLDLEPGRIIELDRSAGAPADVKLNGRLIAHGEIVVVDQDYAVRITRIIENAEA